MDLILHVAVVRSLSELAVGGEAAVHDDGQQQPHHHLHTAPHLGREDLGEARDGELQLGQETVQVREEESLDSDHVGEGDQGESHLLLAEGGDAGLRLAGVAAPSDGETDHEEDDDSGGEIVAEDDHGGLVDVTVIKTLTVTERDGWEDSQRVGLLHEEGGEGEESGEEEGEDDEERTDPTLLSDRDDGRVETVELQERMSGPGEKGGDTYPESHLTGGRHVRVGRPAEQIDEEGGQVVHEEDHQEVVQHADSLTEEGHVLSTAEVLLLQLGVGEVGGHDVGELEEAGTLGQFGDGED